MIRALLACLAYHQTRPDTEPPAWIDEIARRCTLLREGADLLDPSYPADRDANDPIGTEIYQGLDRPAMARQDKAAAQGAKTEQPKEGFWSEATADPASVQFALKVTWR